MYSLSSGVYLVVYFNCPTIVERIALEGSLDIIPVPLEPCSATLETIAKETRGSGTYP